jgi:hypothetical protein
MITPTLQLSGVTLDCDFCPQNAAAITTDPKSTHTVRLMPLQGGEVLDAL